MAPVKYSTMIRSKNHKYDYRLRLVQFAQQHGVKPAARAFRCSRNTVRLWLRRYEQAGRSGLLERSRAPHSCPHKTSKAVERKVIAARKRSGFGAQRLKREFDLPCSSGATQRILSQAGLTRRPRKRRQKKNDLRAVKATYKPFRRFQMDVKHLYDIPFYWPQMKHKKLPKYQYTIREVPTGALFMAFADELSAFNAELVVRLLLAHLRSCGVDTSKILLSTDNGAEFLPEDGLKATVEQLFKGTHRFNPPSCPNANADVESIHQTIETEFFDRETFINRTHFLDKARCYQDYYNFHRTICTKDHRSPLQVLRDKNRARAQDESRINETVLLFAPIDLDTMLAQLPDQTLQGGQYLPVETVFAVSRLPASLLSLLAGNLLS